ncbi:efflux RND transporter periplasmic adaptor subunit [Crocinitomix catalasitica]|uniref:efflux RND transporter periplasmic adaptor subunit n=1 Tax=Crocinitomix catalasitica TaxID=184607 RepID=UPI00047F252C|nr:efflux RND transporter periplasmic adaptor subunit [Crocinitomix catalasitica]
MKNKIIISVILFAGLGAIIYFGFIRNSDTKLNTMEDVHAKDEHGHGAEEGTVVSLNKAQYKSAEISLGEFSQKNLSEIIHANGYTKLPPQNQADVSVFTTGIVKSIRVIEGQKVKKGQVLATIESPEFSKLQQAYLSSKSKMTYLKEEFDRQENLLQNDANSTKIFQKAKAEYDAEQASYDALKTQLRILNINPDGASVSSIPILAPIAGFLTDVFIKIGSSVEIAKPLFSIVDNSEMHVDLLVYEKDLRSVQKGQKVRFTLTNQSNTEIEGEIFNIGKSFENETKAVAVHAHIENEKEGLIPGMYVNAIIDIGENLVDALPEGAIVSAEGREFIFVKRSHAGHGHGHAHGDTSNETEFTRVEVKTGATQLGFVQITPLEKILKSDKIVVKGAYYIQSHLQKSEGAGGHSH